MVFTFPYHDPDGIYNKVFKRNLSLLKNMFHQIFISATPLTCRRNDEFIRFLFSEGITIYKNKENSNIGDHFRNALSISIKGIEDSELIFLSFIDRVLYILESEYKRQFIEDLRKTRLDRLTVFERSTKAWNTHPGNYRNMEQFINNLLKRLIGKSVEMNFCAIALNKDMADKILAASRTGDWAITGEWILLSLKQSFPLITKEVDWLSWEDPFWMKEDQDILREERETGESETIKRIKSNIPFLNLMVEERFLTMYPRLFPKR